jgi:hypothetical protein
MLDFDDVTSNGFYDMGIGGDYASLTVMAANYYSQDRGGFLVYLCCLIPHHPIFV